MMSATIVQGHALTELQKLLTESVQCCVTSPPYFGLRDYQTEPQIWPDGWRGELGLEPSIGLYVEHLVAICRETHRVLRAAASAVCRHRAEP